MRVLYADRSLPHQVVLSCIGQTIYVTCNCLLKDAARNQYGQYNGGSRDVIGVTTNFDQTRSLFNNPLNHDNSGIPFDPRTMRMKRWEENVHGVSSQSIQP